MIAALPLVSAAVTAVGSSGAASAAQSAAASGFASSGVASSAAAGDSFSSMLASFSQNTVDSMKGAEQMSIAGIEGKASTQSVVEAVMSAQESLQTALAVRDKAVNAFQEISRMPI